MIDDIVELLGDAAVLLVYLALLGPAYLPIIFGSVRSFSFLALTAFGAFGGGLLNGFVLAGMSGL